MSHRDELAAVFADTCTMIEEDSELNAAASASAAGSVFYAAYETLPQPVVVEDQQVQVRVSSKRSFEAARDLLDEFPDARVCVHNFASPVSPGGGVKSGSSAQEESLCRVSTLYRALDQKRFWNDYYLPNRARGDARATDDCIWTPEVVVCKTDTNLPERMPKEQWYAADVITCAAPNLRSNVSNAYNPQTGGAIQVSLTELYELHFKRAKRLFEVCAAQHEDCLVLGAFGCGAFKNDPYVVASAWHDALREFEHAFKLVEFAVFHMPYETTNYQAFVEEFDR